MGWFVRRGGHFSWPTIQRGVPAHQRNLGSGVNEVSVYEVHHTNQASAKKVVAKDTQVAELHGTW